MNERREMYESYFLRQNFCRLQINFDAAVSTRLNGHSRPSAYSYTQNGTTIDDTLICAQR